MLDICITASSPSLAPRARARRQASARSFRGRERGRWTAPLSNSAAGVTADYAARAAHSCAAGSGRWLQRAPALPLGRFSGFRADERQCGTPSMRGGALISENEDFYSALFAV